MTADPRLEVACRAAWPDFDQFNERMQEQLRSGLERGIRAYRQATLGELANEAQKDGLYDR